MSSQRIWAVISLVALMGVPLVVVSQRDAFAAPATKKAEWKTTKATSKAKTVKKATAPAPIQAAQPTESEPPTLPATVPDQSQEVLDVDFAMAAQIAAQGPRDGYANALSDEGVLYDANGASPAGREAASSRFGSFPADVKLIRIPERALAAAGSGSSWGTYNIKRGDTVLSSGRYISVWRRETSGWKMISELAAGKTFAPPPASPVAGILPKRPANLARAAQGAAGAASTPTAQPSTPPQSETPPAP